MGFGRVKEPGDGPVKLVDHKVKDADKRTDGGYDTVDHGHHLFVPDVLLQGREVVVPKAGEKLPAQEQVEDDVHKAKAHEGDDGYNIKAIHLRLICYVTYVLLLMLRDVM